MKKPERQKPGPKPTGKGEQVVVRIQPGLMTALDKQVEKTGAGSRAEAIRRIITTYLKRAGSV